MIDNQKRYTGKIIYIDSKGWGFISCPEIRFTRIFFHWTGLVPTLKFDTLAKGDMVTFLAKDYPESGTHAIKIDRLG